MNTKKQLIIAEKPSVARDLARVLGATQLKDGYIEGPRVVVTWCFGHLAGLAPPSDYRPEWGRWELAALPIIPDAFALKASRSGSKQFACIRRLLRDASSFDSVVNACDAGREGELIFGYVYELAGATLPVWRLWIASLTPGEIARGMKELRPGTEFAPLLDAARARNQADWLVGLNATRCVTLAARALAERTEGRGGGEHGELGVVSVGRVQTPTLGLIATRARERAAFESRAFHTLEATFALDARARYVGVLVEDEASNRARRFFADTPVAELEAHLGRVRGSRARVTELTREQVKKPAPGFFDLTSLQRVANTRLGFSAKRTLELAQSLYETHKLLTYPRTDSRHITPELAATIPARLRAALRLAPLQGFAGSITPDVGALGARLVNASRVTDHHAILPTDLDPTRARLAPDEAALYELVARRLLAAISPPAVVSSTRVITQLGELCFVTRGHELVWPGWRAFEGEAARATEKDDDGSEDSEAEDTANIPPELTRADSPVLEGVEAREGATRPPPAYTEASLLGAMERAGSGLGDAELARAMKGSGLGTPATRADTIEKLLERGYVTRKGKSLEATRLGLELIDALSAFPHLTSAELTGRWEAALTRIAHGELGGAAFMEGVRDLTRKIVAHVKAHPPRLSGKARQTLGSCPACRTRKVYVDATKVWCSGVRARDCDLVLGRVLCKKTLTHGQLSRLLADGALAEVKGFTSRTGKKFAAPLKLARDPERGWSIAFDFPTPGEPEDPRDLPRAGPCPVCSSEVALGARRARCVDPECTFSIWTVVAGKTLDAHTLGVLLTERRTPELSGFVSRKNSRSFSAALELADDPEKGWKVSFVFGPRDASAGAREPSGSGRASRRARKKKRRRKSKPGNATGGGTP